MAKTLFWISKYDANCLKFCL